MFEQIKIQIGQNIVGNENKIKMSLAAILSGGHILIEDLPGTGKTTFAKCLTNALNLDFKRIQFTSDLLPSDVLGFSFLSKDKFEIKKGPIIVCPPNKVAKSFFSHLGSVIEVKNEKVCNKFWSTSALMAPFYEFLKVSIDWLTRKGVGQSKATNYITELFLGLSQAN